VLPEVQLDPLGGQRATERLAEHPGLAREQVLRALHQRHLGAHAADRLGELHADGAATQDEQASGHLLQARGLAVRPDAVQLAQTRDGRDHRVRACRQHDVSGGQQLVLDPDPSRTVEPSAAAMDTDAGVGCPAHLAGVVVVGDLEIAPGEDLSGIEPAAVDRLARAGRFARGLQRLAGAQQRLGRDAGPVGALAADQLPLDDRDAQASGRQRPRAVLAGGPAAEDDDVVVRAHPVAPRALSIS
jgi:hypothetical protein